MSLKLGTETGNPHNHLMSGGGQPKPEVGMGCTILMWTDRKAGTIVKVTKTQVHVQEDKAVRVDANGMSENQDYRYEPDPTAPVEVFRLTKRGYRKAGGGYGLAIGYRDSYYDYSF